MSTQPTLDRCRTEPPPAGWEVARDASVVRFQRRLDTFTVELHPHPHGTLVEMVGGYAIRVGEGGRRLYRNLTYPQVVELLAECDAHYSPRVADPATSAPAGG